MRGNMGVHQQPANRAMPHVRNLQGLVCALEADDQHLLAVRQQSGPAMSLETRE